MHNFLKERGAYLNMRNQLLSKHRGEFVAIYKGCLIAIDSDKNRLIARVRKKLGPVRAFIQKIEDNEPQVRLPTSRRPTSVSIPPIKISPPATVL